MRWWCMGYGAGRRRGSLAEVRDDGGQRGVKSFGIISGSGRVYTTFSIEFESFGEAETELPQKRFLLGGRFGDAAQTDLSSVGGGQNYVGALQGGKESQSLH